ncbi:MAG: stalk domain-containing protein [Clostridia bacterium]|nr:stalk domain-containing protein [Clostridia bacterium]
MSYISKISKLVSILLLFAVLMISMTMPEVSRAADIPNDSILKERLNNAVALFVGSPKAYVNGGLTRIDENNSEVRPVVKNSRTLVPIRFISSNLGADVQWDVPSATATITSASRVIKIRLGSNVMNVNNQDVIIDTAAESIGGRTFVPLRALSNALGKSVFWDDRGLIVISSEERVLNPSVDQAVIETLIASFEEPISYENTTVTTSAGNRSVKVIKINPKHPDIRFEVGLPNGRLNQTEDFETMVKNKGAFAAINGNFFTSYDVIKDPIGHIMVDGKLIYMQSGITTVGFSKDGQVRFSKANTFVKGTGKNGMTWTAYEVNTLTQSSDVSIMYTPERGDSVNIKVNGYVASVVNDVVVSNDYIHAPATVNIPSNGYIVFFGDGYAKSYGGQKAFVPGSKIDSWYYMLSNSNPSFDWNNLTCAITGGPDLVLNGQKCPPSTHPAFADSRFTTAASPRTALAVTSNGNMLLVSTSNVTIAELKEIMVKLGAKDAINLDGGASTAMYYDGKVVSKPGRKLETILYVHYK